jgi:integrase
LIALFCEHQRGREIAATTIRRRRLTLAAFQRFIAPAELLEVAGPELIDEFVHRYRAPNTRRAYRADLGAFYRWACKRRLCTRNPVDDTDTIRVPRALPRPVANEFVTMLIETTSDPEIADAIALAAYGSLRCAEIAGLDGADINLVASPPVLVVRGGKGKKDRVVPLHPMLIERLDRRGSGPVIRCQPNSLGRKVAKHLRLQGIDATLHQLRHTFGTEAARASNGNLVVIGELMGHENLNTTRQYTRLAATATAETVAAMFPTPADLAA